jgi:hypothetical protein
MQELSNELASSTELRPEKRYTLLQKWALAIWTTQLLTLLLVVAANEGNSSILYTSPVVAVPGFAFALVTWPLRSWWVLALGLSAPLTTASTAAFIGAFRLDREIAQALTSIMLVIYVPIAAPLAVTAWQRILSRSAASSAWQYSINSLLRLMSTIALLLVLARAAVSLATGDSEVALFTGLAAINLVLCYILIYWFAVQIRRNEPADGAL